MKIALNCTSCDADHRDTERIKNPKSRDGFIDSVKIYACVLVVLGHFIQSMTTASILEETFFVQWFNKTIYYFHVPLFFICSGYLYQKYSKVNSFSQWKSNVLKKVVSLGIPYFVFSIITWIMKSVFSSSVNNEVYGFFETLFLNPIAPYWYLYALFFLFSITLTFNSKKSAIFLLIVALALKFVSFTSFECGIYAIQTILSNEIWFVFGMCISYFKLNRLCGNKKMLFVAVALAIAFVVSSIFVYAYHISYGLVAFSLGVIACVSTMIFAIYFESSKISDLLNSKLYKYTLPVFLMHTIFAAGIRAVLFKLSIVNSFVHIVAGISISFIGPIVAAIVMSKVKYLDFILYPNKYIFKKKG